MNLTPRLTAARVRARQAEQRNVALRVEVENLRRDRDAFAARLADEQRRVRVLQDRLARNDSTAVTSLRRDVALLREALAALDQRNDELRRALARYERPKAGAATWAPEPEEAS